LVNFVAGVITQTVNATAGPLPAERVFDHYQPRQSRNFVAFRVPLARPSGLGERHAKGDEEMLRWAQV
jgi:hypothetical protein